MWIRPLNTNNEDLKGVTFYPELEYGAGSFLWSLVWARWAYLYPRGSKICLQNSIAGFLLGKAPKRAEREKTVVWGLINIFEKNKKIEKSRITSMIFWPWSTISQVLFIRFRSKFVQITDNFVFFPDEIEKF